LAKSKENHGKSGYNVHNDEDPSSKRSRHLKTTKKELGRARLIFFINRPNKTSRRLLTNVELIIIKKLLLQVEY